MEVKTNEGLSSEAVISKLTDASLYTVGEWAASGPRRVASQFWGQRSPRPSLPSRFSSK